MRYYVDFETQDPAHAAEVFRELAKHAKRGEKDGGNVYSKEMSLILGEWSFEPTEPEAHK